MHREPRISGGEREGEGERERERVAGAAIILNYHRLSAVSQPREDFLKISEQPVFNHPANNVRLNFPGPEGKSPRRGEIQKRRATGRIVASMYRHGPIINLTILGTRPATRKED